MQIRPSSYTRTTSRSSRHRLSRAAFELSIQELVADQAQIVTARGLADSHADRAGEDRVLPAEIEGRVRVQIPGGADVNGLHGMRGDGVLGDALFDQLAAHIELGIAGVNLPGARAADRIAPVKIAE